MIEIIGITVALTIAIRTIVTVWKIVDSYEFRRWLGMKVFKIERQERR